MRKSLSLSGKRIIVTRSRQQAGAFIRALEKQGASVLVIPAIAIVDPEDVEPLQRAASKAGTYDLVIFTSANAVRYFFQRKPARITGAICAIGPGTAQALRRRKVAVTFVPKKYVAEGVLKALADFPLRGKRVLIPRAAVARDVIPNELAKRGAIVDIVEAYRTVMPKIAVGDIDADLVTFTSSSTAENFKKLVDSREGRDRERPGRERRGREGRSAGVGVGVNRARAAHALAIPAACIGPITAATARALGWTVAVEARESTVAGLASAIVEHFTRLARQKRG